MCYLRYTLLTTKKHTMARCDRLCRRKNFIFFGVCGVLPLNGKKFIKTEVCGNALLSVVVVASDGNFFNWAQTGALNILELCRYNKDVTYLIQEIDENIKIKHSYIVYKIFRPSFLMS